MPVNFNYDLGFQIYDGQSKGILAFSSKAQTLNNKD